MKTKTSLVFIYLLFLVGCKDSDKEPIPPEERMFPFHFTIHLEKEILPFPKVTRSMPPFDMPEPVANDNGNTEEKEFNELCNTIEYIVYKEGETDKTVRHETFTSEEDMDFGIVYDSLPAGTYTIAFLAYKTCVTSLSDGSVSFQQVSDAFHASFSQEIEATEEIDKDITLSRVVSKIEFVATDNVPEGAVKFIMEVTPYPDLLNICTGEGLASTEEASVFTHNFTTEEIGKNKQTHSFFTFVPADDGTFKVELKAIDSDEQVLRSREVTVTPIKNKIIRYTGKLYSHAPSDDTFELSIHANGKWDEPEEKELED